MKIAQLWACMAQAWFVPRSQHQTAWRKRNEARIALGWEVMMSDRPEADLTDEERAARDWILEGAI